MTGVPRVLVVDASASTEALQARLTEEGHEVTASESGKVGLCHLGAEPFDLVVLELDLPDLEGDAFIATAREMTDAPIIVLTQRSSPSDKVRALNLGANDYVTKPFDMGELLARIGAALRSQEAARSPKSQVARSDRLRLDVSTRSAVVDGRIVRLSARECAILQVLVEADGVSVQLEEIVEKVWGRSSPAGARRVRVLIWQVRRKIEPDPTRPCFIISEPALGYRLHQAGVRMRSPERSC